MRQEQGSVLLIEAVLVQAGPDGEPHTVFFPLGQLWRAPAGGYFGELKREPTEWSYSPERRIYLRLQE